MKKISDRVTSNKSKHLLVEIELKTLEKIDTAYFRSKNYFEENYLVCQPANKYFEREGNNISSCEFKGLANEKFSFTTTTSNNKFAACLIYPNARLVVKFNGDFLKQDKAPYNNGPIVTIYIVYKLIPDTKDCSITLENSFFWCN